jgi:hypothetical protein
MSGTNTGINIAVACNHADFVKPISPRFFSGTVLTWQVTIRQAGRLTVVGEWNNVHQDETNAACMLQQHRMLS